MLYMELFSSEARCADYAGDYSGSKRFGAGWPHVVSQKRVVTNISQIGSFPDVGVKIKNI